MRIFLSSTITLAACSSAAYQANETFDGGRTSMAASSVRANTATAGKLGQTAKGFPPKYLHAFSCDFDENPLTAAERQQGTPAGRAERKADLAVLRSLEFKREGRDGDLESVGGKIAAPAGLTILGLPVQSVEINGMIGDANSMYVTTFDYHVTVDQVVKAARLTMDRKSYDKYKIRHYSRQIDDKPYTNLYLDDRGGSNALLVCQVQSTPD